MVILLHFLYYIEKFYVVYLHKIFRFIRLHTSLHSIEDSHAILYIYIAGIINRKSMTIASHTKKNE